MSSPLLEVEFQNSLLLLVQYSLESVGIVGSPFRTNTFHGCSFTTTISCSVWQFQTGGNIVNDYIKKYDVFAREQQGKFNQGKMTSPMSRALNGRKCKADLAKLVCSLVAIQWSLIMQHFVSNKGCNCNTRHIVCTRTSHICTVNSVFVGKRGFRQREQWKQCSDFDEENVSGF